MISADDSPPYDRPNLSKDFLAGTAPDDWIPLRAPDFYADRRIDLKLGSRVASLEVQQKRVQLEDGKTYEYGALLLATGAAMLGRLRTTLAVVRIGATSSAPMEAAASSLAHLLPCCGNA